MPLVNVVVTLIVVVVAVVLWLLYGFGIISHSGNISLPVVK
jgi:hypothetical protein